MKGGRGDRSFEQWIDKEKCKIKEDELEGNVWQKKDRKRGRRRSKQWEKKQKEVEVAVEIAAEVKSRS